MSGCLDSLNSRRRLSFGGERFDYYSLEAAQRAGVGGLDKLPRSLKILYENLLRHEDGFVVTSEMLEGFVDAARNPEGGLEVFFHPTRVLLNDSAGIPLMADFAALRDAIKRCGGDASNVNPKIQVDMVVDHSVMVDTHGSPHAFATNISNEYRRNRERYDFLRWAQLSFENFRVVPPGKGICHQVNLEYLSRVACTKTVEDDRAIVFPETLLGTDSHTPMINGIGVLGWGVGGIEAGTVLLGQAVTMSVPRVVGCRLLGEPPAGTLGTDIALHITEKLREYGVVGAFVEFYGEGLSKLPISDRATIANMAPEYGATIGFFPWDEETIKYLDGTGRGGAANEIVKGYAKVQGLWHDPWEELNFGESLDFDLSKVSPSVSGPKRPQDRIALSEVATSFNKTLRLAPRAAAVDGVPVDGNDYRLRHGDIVIAAITSCTNTANFKAMLAAGLIAKKAVERGLRPKPWVKTSLAPGSRVIADYLSFAGLQEFLNALGYHVVGYGCTTCMGNSGPLDNAIEEAITENDLIVASVLSGNRNFEGRIHNLVRANYICSPALVIAYALKGNIATDISAEPIDTDRDGQPVFLSDLWPTENELAPYLDHALEPHRFISGYAEIFEGDDKWKAFNSSRSELFAWDPASTYIKSPPLFDDFSALAERPVDIIDARALAVLGDSVTTDHISPIGTIPADSAAGSYLQKIGVETENFNSYGSRRINHDVMIRGTFANVRIQNEMVPERTGGWTRLQPEGNVLPIHEAARHYERTGYPVVVIAGKEYGTGSSRDWAAKGTRLLGVKAVIAESFERIHRSNLIGLGVTPLQFAAQVNRHSLGIDGTERLDILGLGELTPRAEVVCRITRMSGEIVSIRLLCRIDTEIELCYFNHGGALNYVARGILNPV
ncbi:MAG: aconitate hydratase AcnA [Proteobacteria bacterium]|nr:MAG: aconitate hydratase AcnA [Pseudomonadota bacterium]